MVFPCLRFLIWIPHYLLSIKLQSVKMMHPALKTSEVETGKVEEDSVNNILKDATNAWQEIV